MIMLRDIDYIQEKMRITNFDGRGYTSIVDENGTFVVSDVSMAALGQQSNCFDLLEGRPIRGMTLEEIKAKFRRRESFTFWYTDANNVTKFILFSPSETSNWTFLSSIEQSVYTDQMQQFVDVIVFVMGGLLAIFLVMFLLYEYSRKKLTAFYSSVAEGVRSRQYYDDQVVDEPVTALAVVDIDHLKWINDSHGHLVGDKAIKEMALVLLKWADELGEICRFGGDEFIVAFQQPLPVDAFKGLLRSIVADVRKIRLEECPDFRMTLSIGAFYGEGTAGEIFAKADELLYEAKKERDRAVVRLTEAGEAFEL